MACPGAVAWLCSCRAPSLPSPAPPAARCCRHRARGSHEGPGILAGVGRQRAAGGAPEKTANVNQKARNWQQGGPAWPGLAWGLGVAGFVGTLQCPVLVRSSGPLLGSESDSTSGGQIPRWGRASPLATCLRVHCYSGSCPLLGLFWVWGTYCVPQPGYSYLPGHLVAPRCSSLGE